MRIYFILLFAGLVGGCLDIDGVKLIHDEETNALAIEVEIDTGASVIRGVEVDALLTFIPVETFSPRTTSIHLAPSGVRVRGKERFTATVPVPFPRSSCLTRVRAEVDATGRALTGRVNESAAVSSEALNVDRLLDISLDTSVIGAKYAVAGASGRTFPLWVRLSCPRDQATDVTLAFKDPAILPLYVFSSDLSEDALTFPSGVVTRQTTATLSLEILGAGDGLNLTHVKASAFASTTIDGTRVCHADQFCVFSRAPGPGDPDAIICTAQRDLELAASCGP